MADPTTTDEDVVYLHGEGENWWSRGVDIGGALHELLDRT